MPGSRSSTIADAASPDTVSDPPAARFGTIAAAAATDASTAPSAATLEALWTLPGSPHAQADDVEVGGQRGREALDRLRNVVGRIESSWRPARARG